MTPSTQQRSIPRAYAATLLLGVAISPFILNLQGFLSSFYPPSSFFLRRSLSFNDLENYSTLQDVNDIDPSIEQRAVANANDDKCRNLFLFLPDPQHFSSHGHGSQLNTYIMSTLIGTYLNRNVLLLEPPNELSTFAGGSQFGCPVDAFEEIHKTSPAASSSSPSSSSPSDSWKIKENFPGGFSRLIDHQTWLSGGCPIPCADTYTYNDWARMSVSSTAMNVPITCKESDGRTVNVIATAGGPLRQYSRSKTKDKHFIASERWAIKLGATLTEARIFSTLSNAAMWDYAMGLMIKAGFLRLQPWIARDVEMLLKSFDLFHAVGTKNPVYDSIHVRRGDKLIEEARGEVVKYWRSQGHSDTENLPTNYVPFAHYLDQFKKEECPMNELGEVTERMTRVVYVATDDPIVVKEEIANLPNRIDERKVLWNDCHELSFYFNPTDDSSFHLNGDGETGFSDGTEDNCFKRYHRNIASVADMMILAKSRTFVGEFNSNWGKLLRSMRVRLDTPILQDDGSNSDTDKKVVGDLNPRFSKTLDMRIAWGPTVPRLPGM